MFFFFFLHNIYIINLDITVYTKKFQKYMQPRNFEAISVLIYVLDEDGKENYIEITNQITETHGSEE